MNLVQPKEEMENIIMHGWVEHINTEGSNTKEKNKDFEATSKVLPLCIS
jgi:hypothetical protein